MSALTPLLQTVSISSALIAAGGIATLTLFDVPILQAQPASRSLPSTRWLFSRGSHIFPTAAFVSGAGFGVLAFQALPIPVSRLFKAIGSQGIRAIGARSGGYIIAGLLCLSIAPWTSIVMIPNNFALIKLNADKMGSRSEKSAEVLNSISSKDSRQRTSMDSVNGKGEANQWTDLSGPQEETPVKSTAAEDKKVKEMLELFGRQNMVRAVLMGLGGVVGLWMALV
ncbi:hypothetical protein N0V93_008469 [Gnomoniopsis smithogilvyi]|uniref:DUF1772-domain-containing protein n=1 Tax=Gnomoniopsis smithogilvyi TaxID=1191159 RepID=A0A9W8YMS8_9PEZI|nr:hypothetical protein N0V93_008469 [Gnomoniopsis smithogilvyi]